MSVGNYSMADIAGLVKSTQTPKAERSTSREGNTELSMQDFLQLMVVQLQNQSMDDTMDTGEMMSQMVQMQMVSAITNMNETSLMTYASSMVGKEVTIGIRDGNTLKEVPVKVVGTGMSNGEQVIFGEDEKGNVETYKLNQIMAIGKLPPKVEATDPDAPNGPNDAIGPANPDKPADGTGDKGEGSEEGGEEPGTPSTEGAG